MSLSYVRPNTPTFQATPNNHINLLRNSVSILAEYVLDWLLVGFTFYLIFSLLLPLTCVSG